MALPNIFKKKRDEKEKPETVPVKKEIQQKESSLNVKRRVKKAKRTGDVDTKIELRRDKFYPDAYKVLKRPRVTEKATRAAENNDYIFEVWPRSTKPEVKKAVESVYGVRVVSVRIINIPKKPRRLGRISGWRKGYKKAIIKIQKGQKIEVLPR